METSQDGELEKDNSWIIYLSIKFWFRPKAMRCVAGKKYHSVVWWAIIICFIFFNKQLINFDVVLFFVLAVKTVGLFVSKRSARIFTIIYEGDSIH